MAKKKEPPEKKESSGLPSERTVHLLVEWLTKQGYWKALGGLVILIFAWGFASQIARHFFP
jgi:hypothetical protein